MNMASLIGPLALCLSLAGNIRAQEIRLDSGTGPYAKMPMTQQGNLGICYSHAMAQAASAELIKQGKLNPKIVSSPYLASLEAKNLYLLNLLHWNRSIEGGYSCRAFKKSIKRYGTCASNDIENKFYTTREYYTRTWLNGIVPLVHADLRNIYQSKSKSHQKAMSDAEAFLTTVYGDDAKKDPAIIKNALDADTANVFSARLLSKQCQERVAMSKYKCQKDNLFFHSDLGVKRSLQKIEKNLKAQRGVMVGYCSSILSKGPGHRGLMTSECGMHASVIIGQRKGTKGTELLIRNSWGTSCSNMHSAWECQNGQIWVNGADLMKNSQSLEVIVAK